MTMLSNNNELVKIINHYIVLNEALRNKLVSLYAYGSFITGEMSEKSDIDCCVVADNIDFSFLDVVGKFKADLEKHLQIEVFINALQLDDINNVIIKNKLFVHRERPFLFLFEFKNYFKLIYGKDLIDDLRLPAYFQEKLKKECVKLVRNFRYMNYKLIVNNNNAYPKDALLKNILFSAKVYEIFCSNQFFSYKKSVEFAVKKLNNSLPQQAYAYLKQNNHDMHEQPLLLNQSVDYYDKLLSVMSIVVKSQKTVKGCFDFNDFKVYFEASDLDKSGDAKKAVVFLNGMPRPASGIDKITGCFVEAGYVFFSVYFPGYWEAGGKMDLATLPQQISELGGYIKQGEFYDLFSQRLISLNINEVHLLGSSFGAMIALLTPIGVYNKIVAVSPLLDFPAHQTIIDDLFVKLNFFKQVIRFKESLSEVKRIFNDLDPKTSHAPLDIKNTLIVADKNDPQIKFNCVRDYATEKKVPFISTNYDTHGYKILEYDEPRNAVLKFFEGEGVSDL